TWQTALMVAGGAAFLSVGAAGVVLMEGPGVARQAREAPPFEGEPRAAVALAPEPLGPARPAAVAAPPPQPAPVEVVAPPADSARADYVRTVAALERQEPGALARLKVIADSGYAPAQMSLARLYEKGQAGVTLNLAEAR